MSLGDFSRVESFSDCFSIKTWSAIKDCIAINSVFNKFTLSSKERLLFTLDYFKDIIGVSKISRDEVVELLPTVLDVDKSCSDSALIQ